VRVCRRRRVAWQFSPISSDQSDFYRKVSLRTIGLDSSIDTLGGMPSVLAGSVGDDSLSGSLGTGLRSLLSMSQGRKARRTHSRVPRCCPLIHSFPRSCVAPSARSALRTRLRR
jgi:hypothetical protein